MAERTAQQRIEDASKVSQFLKDEVIAGALSRMERRFYEEFVGADSSEERIRAQAKAVVLKNFELEMQSLLDQGEMEVLKAAKEAGTGKPKE